MAVGGDQGIPTQAPGLHLGLDPRTRPRAGVTGACGRKCPPSRRRPRGQARGPAAPGRSSDTGERPHYSPAAARIAPPSGRRERTAARRGRRAAAGGGAPRERPRCFFIAPNWASSRRGVPRGSPTPPSGGLWGLLEATGARPPSPAVIWGSGRRSSGPGQRAAASVGLPRLQSQLRSF